LRDIPKIKLFEGLPEETVRGFLDAAQFRLVRPETVLFGQGDPARAIHVLASGYVRMTQTSAAGARVILRYVEPGEVFGTPALLKSGHYPGEAVAMTACTEMQWPAQTIRELLAKHPGAWMNAAGELEDRLRDLEGRMRELSGDPVDRRIAHAVLRLVQKLGRPVGDAVEVPFPVARQDIADMTGTTLHTVSRILGGWQRQGLLERGRKRIAVADMRRLAVLLEAGWGVETPPRRTRRPRSARR
jgi:CRP-like cAMP-binding protein